MIEYCIREARKLPYVHGRYRLYSVITNKRGKIVGESSNDYSRSHPLMKKYSLKLGECEHKIYMHSELGALLKARDNARNGKLYVARVDSKGNAVNACPCIVCQRLIKEFGIKSIEFTT